MENGIPDPNKQANEVLFSCKTKKVDHPPLVFNGSPVVQVKETKHLGLVLHFNLNFEKHLTEKIKKAKKIIGIMKHLNNLLPFKTLNQMYKTLVRPHLDYCDIIYHIPQIVRPLAEGGGITLHSLMEKAEQVQYQAALAVTGAWQGTDRVRIYEELGWESLTDRRMLRRVLQVHKILDGKTPSYLREKLPQSRNNLINLPNVFQEIRYGTQRYLNSFFPDATKNWNYIITDFNDFPTFEQLKKHLFSLYRPEIKSTFRIHHPDLRHIFQLRLGLSHLRHHKKSHKFLDTPSANCICGKGVEDNHHFLISCPRYSIHRGALFDTIETILHRKNLCLFLGITNFANLLLYGHSKLNEIENGNILLATLEYIAMTKRFAK